MGWGRVRGITVVLVLAAVELQGQVPPIVVSEYFNTSPLPVEEWTELLVVADTLDLRGYILTDNNQTQTQQQGGVRFRNHPLWQRLRAGTIIVINHRGTQVVDDDPRDGYIELGAQNTTYFEQVRLDSNPGLSWEDVALNVALQGDILQILDPSGRHVHALGHRDTPGPFFQSLPPPKVHHNGSCPNPGSVRVVPGLSLAAYAAGAGTDSTAALSEDVTKGLPNQSPAFRDRNQLLWRWLRQPRWNSPQMLRAELTPNGVVLEWSAAEDPFPGDSIQGYIVVRDTVGQRSIPEDGRTYSVGERVGSGIVVAQTLGAARQARDTFAFPCGARLVYRVYAFRYETDRLLGNAPGATLARGRSYNETAYAEAVLEKPLPVAPQIRATTQEICQGESALLWVEGPDTLQYQWLLNGAPIPGATGRQYTATVGGRYAVQVKTVLGCTVTTAEIELRVHPRPSVWVVVQGDTLLCPGDTVVLRASGAWRYRWYRDGVLVDSAATLAVTQPGRYWVVGWSEAGCGDTSAVVTIRQRRIVLRMQPTALDFGVLGACESGSERTVELTNDGDTPLLLFRPVFPSGFAVVGQSFPVELGVGQSLRLRVRFAPPRSGVYAGVLRFPVQPCSVVVELPVQGQKGAGVASLSLAEVSFGVEALCVAQVRDTSLWLTNAGGAPLEAEAMPLAPPFAIVSPTFPAVVAPGDSLRIQLRYTPVLGRHQQELALAVRMGSCSDTVRANLVAVAERPQVQLSATHLEFPELRGCVAAAETSIVVSNLGAIPVQIRVPPLGAVTVQGVPFELQPLQSQVVRLRVTPPVQGLFTAEVPFIVEPCADTLRVSVRLWSEGITAGLARSVVDFGTLVWCTGPDTLWQEVPFQMNAAAAELVGYSVRGDTAAFLLQWVPGQQFSSGQAVWIGFHPPQPGLYEASVEYSLRVDTCQIVQSVRLRGTARESRYELQVDGVDFGRVAVGGQSQRLLRVRNPNDFPLVLEALEGVAPPFAFQALPRLPDTLAAGAERTYVLVYAPQQAPRWDTLRLTVRWSEPCDTLFRLVFVGEAVEGQARPVHLRLEVPVLRAAPGQRVEIPVWARAEQGDVEAAVYFLRVRFRYDWRLYALHRVESMLPVGWSEPQPGQVVVEFPAGLRLSGPIAQLVGEALWHPRMQTPLELEPDSLSSAVPVVLSVGSGMLVVDSTCAAWQRRFGIGQATTLQVEPGDCPELLVVLGSDEEAQLLLVDLQGREVLRWHTAGGLRDSPLRLVLPCSHLAAGVYGVVLQQGTLRRLERLLLIR
jgi:hypothetical protein